MISTDKTFNFPGCSSGGCANVTYCFGFVRIVVVKAGSLVPHPGARPNSFAEFHCSRLFLLNLKSSAALLKLQTSIFRRYDSHVSQGTCALLGLFTFKNTVSTRNALGIENGVNRIH